MAVERQIIAQPGGSIGGRVIASPFQFTTTDDDNLRVECANSVAGVTLKIQGRRLTVAGAIEPFSFDLTPASDRTVTTTVFKLGAGALLNLTIFCNAGTPKIGQTFVSARLIRGLTGATIILGTLLQGYVTSAQHLAYPGSPIQSSIEGGGVIRTITGTDPAPGAEMGETVPTGARWQLLALAIQLTPSGAAGNRLPSFEFHTGSFPLVRCPQVGAVAAGQTRIWTWGIGTMLSTLLSDSNRVAGLPQDFPLLAGQILQTHTDGLLAGDDYGAPVYTVREWLEVQ